MGWWADGDDLMGDGPADEAHAVLDAAALATAGEGRHLVTSEELADGVAAALRFAGRVDLHAVTDVAGYVRDALDRLTCAEGCEPIRRKPLRSPIAGALATPLARCAQTWRDSGAERDPRLRELVRALTFVIGPDVPSRLRVAAPLVKPELFPPVPEVDLRGALAAATPEARALLDDAARLAVLRARDDLGRRSPPVLERTDLLRALIARDGLRPLTDGRPFTEGFAAHQAHWRERLASAPPAPELRIDPTWTVWWESGLARAPKISAHWLLGALDRRALQALAACDDGFVQGLVIEEEVVSAYAARQREIAGWAADEAVPPAYLDRGGTRAALEAAMANERVVAVIVDGPVRLAETLVRAVVEGRDTEGRSRLGPLVRQAEATSPENSWDHAAAGSVFTPTALGSTPGGWQALSDLGPEGLGRLLEGEARLVICVDGETANHLPLPGARVTLPPPSDLDLIPLWLCERPAIAAAGGPRFSLGTLVEALARADEDDRRSLDWTRLAPWLEVPSRADRVPPSLVRELTRGRLTDRSTGTRFFERYLDSPERAAAIIDLDRRLS